MCVRERRVSRLRWSGDIRYLEALRVLNRSHTVLNRQYFCECKRQYKSLIRKKKRRYEMTKFDKLEQLRHCKPRDCWKYFKNKSNANSLK